MITSYQETTLSIIIVNYKTPKLLMDCLSSVLPEIDKLNAKIVVVDNNSQDDSPQLIRKWISQNDLKSMIIFIESEKNGGFAAGNNIGIKALKAKYYLLLNSDTIVKSGAIVTLLETMTANQNLGIVSPRLEWPDGRGQKSCFNYHTPISEFLDAAQTGFIDSLLRKYVVALPVQDHIIKIQWTCFACVLIRDEVFQKIGLLDEGYFMYYEDVEFCSRTHKAGWEILSTPDSTVIHLEGGSSYLKDDVMSKKRLPIYYYESRARYFYQVKGRFSLLLANIMWSLGRTISKTRQLFGRKDKQSIKGQWKDIWKNYLSPLKRYSHPDNK